jgi:hypothetical protein
METSCYHGDRGVASLVNGGELPKGRGVSHAFKGKSPSSRRTQVRKNALVREISKTAPAGTGNTKLRQRQKSKATEDSDTIEDRVPFQPTS